MILNYIMKKTLLLFLCACALVSCSQDTEMFAEDSTKQTAFEEGDSTGVELRTSLSQKEFYSYSNSQPLYEYICTNVNGKTDYYYTMENKASINVNGYSYMPTRKCKIRLIATQFPASDIYGSYYQNFPVYRFYSPSTKRHRFTYKNPVEQAWNPYNPQPEDYICQGIVGYNVLSLLALEQNPKPVGLSEAYNYVRDIYRLMTSPDASAEYEYPGTEWLCGFILQGYCHRTN